MTAYAFFGSKQVSENSVITDFQDKIDRQLFNKSYFDLGQGNLERLNNTQSFVNRASNKYLAQTITVGGKTYEAGITLTCLLYTSRRFSTVSCTSPQYSKTINNIAKERLENVKSFS